MIGQLNESIKYVDCLNRTKAKVDGHSLLLHKKTFASLLSATALPHATFRTLTSKVRQII
ncbi:MAG: hypothetical protein A4E49_01504 [Methanosaeta sp. PtaU1.Bin112]|nr:MAG: hypothetical protein A4E49_01504 [Methanosaeta sp. PtaU1.Bin112]